MNAKGLHFLIILLITCTITACAQNPQNWTSKQLIEPSELAPVINSKNAPLIFNVGPAATIPNSVDIGMVRDKENIDKLKKQLITLSRKTKIVVYCGCCPYEHCPNVRPAIALLKEMNFTNFLLLDLPHNIKTDWIDKGYPTIK